MISINRSIDLIICIIFHFPFIMNFFNIENISISMIRNEKLLFLITFVGIYSNIVFLYFNRIRLVNNGGLIEEIGLIVNN